MPRGAYIKALMGLASSVIDHASLLDQMLSESQILIKESPLQEHLAKVLIAELVWGKGALPGESKPVRAVVKHKSFFRGDTSFEKQPQKKVRPFYDRMVFFWVIIVDPA